MSQTTVNLGHVPVNRGEYSSSATYYRDNIVQYRNSSYICNIEEPDVVHPVGITGVAPYDSDPAVPNAGWAVFANDSNGVGEGVYNVSVDHTTDGQPKKYETLSQAIADVPQAKKKGGMSVKFVHTSDNKYVQYRLMAQSFTTDTTQWAIADEGVYVENLEFIYVKTDAEDKILWAIKIDGGIYYGAGCPQQVKDYIEEKITELGLTNVNDIIAFLGNIEGTTLSDLLAGKVDVEEGKSLIDGDYADSVSITESAEWIDVKTDNEGRILEGTKIEDGTKVFNTDVEINKSIKTSSADITSLESDFLEAKVDNDYKILEGIKKDGKKYISKGIEIGDVIENTSEPNNSWLNVVTDKDNKILEGLNTDGEKHISKFDNETSQLIKDIANGDFNGKSFSIPVLDANFTAPVPFKVYNGDNEDNSVKGTDAAKYVFNLPLSNDAFNIRFKFKITENLLNQNKNAVIAKLGTANCVSAVTVPLTQITSTYTLNDETKTTYWTSVKGGISINGSNTGQGIGVGQKGNQNIGLYAFYIKYTGTSHDVTIENDGEKFILTIDGVATNFLFTDYPTVSELYTALSNTTDIEVSFTELDNHNSNELAKFPVIKLVSQYYTATTGESDAAKEEYWDAAPFFIRYAKDVNWHQVEIAKIGNVVYSVVDGLVITLNVTNPKELTIGGNCGVVLKDMEVHLNSSYDAEYFSGDYAGGIFISSVHPHIIIHEGHGVYDVPTYGNTIPDIETTTDRLKLVFSALHQKGYVPVSIYDVAEFYESNKMLPKRCYVTMYDDYKFSNCLDIRKRIVHTHFGVKPTLDIVTDPENALAPIDANIVYNGETISLQAAVDMCRMYKYDLITHTRNHRNCIGTKPSTYIDELIADIHDGDIKNIDCSIIVYPYGTTNAYLFDTFEWLGFRIGIYNVGPYPNIKMKNKYCIMREDFGVRNAIADIINKII